MTESFDFRTAMQHIDPTPVRPLGMTSNPVPTLRALYDRALEMCRFYTDRAEPEPAIHWGGQALAFATLLRDHYDWDQGTELIARIPAGA